MIRDNLQDYECGLHVLPAVHVSFGPDSIEKYLLRCICSCTALAARLAPQLLTLCTKLPAQLPLYQDYLYSSLEVGAEVLHP